jgi:uncharacterized membrane protein (UPF0127 family)
VTLFIHNPIAFIIKKLAILVILISFLISCQDTQLPFKDYRTTEIILDAETKLITFVAITDQQQRQGLSSLKPEQFADNYAMLFPAKRDKVRQFWMPDTHFDLDIFFLSKDFYVLDIERNFPHYPHKGPEDRIPMTRPVLCRHVLEVKSSSPLAKKIKIGMILNLKDKIDL